MPTFSSTFCSGLIWSVLRITACAIWGIMSYIVKLPLCKSNKYPNFLKLFVVVLSRRFLEYQPVKDGFKELYSQNSSIANERQYFLALFVKVLSCRI